CMTRSSINILYELDPEIDGTLLRLRKVRSTVVSNSGSYNYDNSAFTTNNSEFFEYSSSDINLDFNFGVKPEPTENNG
ncbi:hypothetical protein CR513_28014, partial [Mucuna pruriens]